MKIYYFKPFVQMLLLILTESEEELHTLQKLCLGITFFLRLSLISEVNVTTLSYGLYLNVNWSVSP